MMLFLTSVLQVHMADVFSCTLESCFKTGKYLLINSNFSGKIKKIRSDINENGIEELYILKNDQLSIFENGTMIWQSESSWKVDDFILADINTDNKYELVISIWKAGDFGEIMPFWEQENDLSVKNHLFIYKFNKNKPEALWHSSNLEKPNCQLAFTDFEKDGIVELVVLEGSYESGCGKGRLAIWRWSGWGFVNVWRDEKAVYKSFRIDNNKLTVY